MPTILQTLEAAKLIHPPAWLSTNVCYLTQAGSVAYGTNTADSDVDVYGVCIPPRDMVFPHLAGAVPGFDKVQNFDQFQAHHIKDPSGKDKEYDFQVFGIVKFFRLLMENNPNVIDAIYTPQFCVMQLTRVGEMIRQRRDLFLHKGSWWKFKGYAYSQLHKMTTKNPKEGSVREGIRNEFGFDVKFAAHVVRLLYEVEMILGEGTLDLQRNREHLKSIRRGEIPEADIRKWASEKETHLERLYESSSLRKFPDEPAVKQLLLDCLEHHFGDLSTAVRMPGLEEAVLAQIASAVHDYERKKSIKPVDKTEDAV